MALSANYRPQFNVKLSDKKMPWSSKVGCTILDAQTIGRYDKCQCKAVVFTQTEKGVNQIAGRAKLLLSREPSGSPRLGRSLAPIETTELVVEWFLRT